MKLTRKDSKLIVKIIKTIPNTKITPEIDNLFTDIYQQLNKPPKYLPIETAPIGKAILIFNKNNVIWGDFIFNHQSDLDVLIKKHLNFTHWRPMPKGPK